jgi:hypothetical protein
MPWIVVLCVVGALVSGCGRAPAPEVKSPCDAEFAQGEFGSDYAMLASLSRPPAVGETATLTIGVCAKTTAPAKVSVRLTGGVEWRTPPEGTTVTVAPGPYGDCVATATGQWDLTAMTPRDVTGTVVATEAGTAELAGIVESASGRPGPGNSAYVYLTVGDESSEFGYPDLSSDSSATNVQPKLPDCRR